MGIYVFKYRLELYVCMSYWDICGKVQLGHVNVGTIVLYVCVGTIVLYVCRYYCVICV